MKFNVFAWFQSVKKHSLFKFVKTQAKHQTWKYCKILPGFYTYMWDMAFEGFDFKFCNTNFLGTTLVTILSLNSSNSSEFLNKKYINKAYKCDFTAKRGTPNGTQKKFFENCKFGAFQRRVNHVYSHPRSKVTYLSIFMIFWYSIEFAKISLFRLKLSKNLQSL